MKLSVVWMEDDIFVKWIIIVVYKIVFLRVWMKCIVMVNISKYVVYKKCFLNWLFLCVFWFSINIVVFNIF